MYVILTLKKGDSSMNNLADKFFESIKGKKVGFIGIGTSNLPLIKLFSDKGAVVSA